jgi:hypothetical protein
MANVAVGSVSQTARDSLTFLFHAKVEIIVICELEKAI